jgi:hypothetical protein
MAPKHHHTPLSGGDRKALKKELSKARAMTGILAESAEEKRRVGEALIREADNLACQSWNERLWSDGGPAQPSPTIWQAINGGFPWWLEVQCSRCRTASSIDLTVIKRPDATFVHELEGKLRCQKCSKRARPGDRLPQGVLHQLAPRRRNNHTTNI